MKCWGKGKLSKGKAEERDTFCNQRYSVLHKIIGRSSSENFPKFFQILLSAFKFTFQICEKIKTRETEKNKQTNKKFQVTKQVENNFKKIKISRLLSFVPCVLIPVKLFLHGGAQITTKF